MELKVVLQLRELRVNLIGRLLGLEDVSHEQVRHKVEEDKNTGTRTESHVKSALLDLKAPPHRSLNIEHFLNRAHLASKSVCTVVGQVEACLCIDCIHGLCHDCSF